MITIRRVLAASAVIAAAAVAGCGAHNPGSPGGSGGRSLVDALTGRTGGPECLLVYVDVTRSDSPGFHIGAWSDAERRVISFMSQAAPGSACEVWTTSAVPGRPMRQRVFRTGRALPRDRKRLSREVAAGMAQAEARSEKGADALPYSPVMEDTYSLIERGSGLGVPYRLVDETDCLQYSPSLRATEILRAQSDPSALVGRTTKEFPPPDTSPADVSLVWYPGDAGGRPLTGVEEEALTGFFARMVREWGSNCTVSQPSDG